MLWISEALSGLTAIASGVDLEAGNLEDVNDWFLESKFADESSGDLQPDYVDEVPTPPPAPTPSPPPAEVPGLWTASGSACVVKGSCVSSGNYPNAYDNNETCVVHLDGEIPISVIALNTESKYDWLMIGGKWYSGEKDPQSDTYNGIITWSSDGSVIQSGWKFCMQK